MPHPAMKAARYYGPGQSLRLEEVPVPRLAPGEALLRVRAAGICHTELHLLDGVLNLGVTPLTPGHEVVAEVIETRGASAVSAGERVLLWYYAPCGHCRLCRAGAENLCPNAARQFGFSADGGYAECMVAPTTSLVPLPHHLSDLDAVGLACGGATALHAVRAIGQVQLGETAVVYGIGGVGFYLIQIARRAGARVIALGRTPEKLALARELGAHAVIDTRHTDALAAVQDLTGGNGAEVVFDLVASRETMPLAVRMLTRRGRLVFCGYGDDRFAVNPLRLVLREIQVRGAVGNTLAELHEAVDLAASGQLRSIVDRTFALGEVNTALAALRAGQIVGRAVLLPQGQGEDPGRGTRDEAREGDRRHGARRMRRRAESDGSVFPQAEPIGPKNLADAAELATIDRPGLAEPAQPDTESLPSHPRTTAAPHLSIAAPALPPISEVPAPDPPFLTSGGSQAHPYEAELLALIGRGMDAACPDEEFDALARGIFAYQYECNEPYRRFCDLRGVAPGRVGHWSKIPAVPIGAFKEVTLACEPIEDAAACFMSSGTTRADQRSRHYHPSLAVYDAATTTNFAAHLLPDGAQLPFLVLNPPPDALPHSSLAYYLGLMLRRYGAAGSDFFVDDHGLQHSRLDAALAEAVRAGQPVFLLGATFAFVHLLDRLTTDGARLSLPGGSRTFDTGGVKGRSREVDRDELIDAISTRLGIPPDAQVNMYGLTELSTQFIDANLRRRQQGLSADRFKSVPPWARTRVLDPATLTELRPGEVGVLCHTDLANRASVTTILTEDLGVQRGAGFEILGRVSGSAARGCSIALDELLSAARGQS